MALGSSLLRTVGRMATAPIFIIGGYSALTNPGGRVEMAAPTLDRIREYVPALPDDNELLVRINGGIQLAAGTTLLLGIKPRLSALALAGSLIPTTIAGHAFWEDEEPQATAQKMQFAKNLAALGGLMLIAGADDPHKAIEKAADKAGRKGEKRGYREAKEVLKQK